MLMIQAARARAEIAQIYRDIDMKPTPEFWQSIKMGVKRDLQARRLRPNVAVPPRRQVVDFVKVMREETGSIFAALGALMHDGTWTSSGGSFRLAEEMGFDVTAFADRCVAENGSFQMLEIGAGWAGLRTPHDGDKPRNIAGLAERFKSQLGRNVHIHMTNLTPWHGGTLPNGVSEHPYVTAGALSALEIQGVLPGSCDFIYSQAAAYFEPDQVSFLTAAATFLKPGGVLIFNHKPEFAGQIDTVLNAQRLRRVNRISMGGMNGSVVHFERPPADAKASLAAFDPEYGSLAK